jgi:6-phosphogluconolactonase
VPPEHPENNYGMAMKTLFSSGAPKGCSVERMIGESEDLVSVAELYAEQLTNSIDILLLGIGDDGHIESLFPHSTLLHEQKLLCAPVTGSKSPHKRLTITPHCNQKRKINFYAGIRSN